MSDYDALIVGAGHNGLTCAAYLAMRGLRVKVVDRRRVIGGAAVTEEFHPGFRNSVAAYTVSLLNPKVIADLGLHHHGLRIVERRAQSLDRGRRRDGRARERQCRGAAGCLQVMIAAQEQNSPPIVGAAMRLLPERTVLAAKD